MIENMKTTNTLSGFTYTPFTREELIKNIQERKEGGQCPVQDPKFYEPWDMIEYGSEEWEQEMKNPKYEQIRKERMEMKRLKFKRLKRGK
jgi:hypothetical protein